MAPPGFPNAVEAWCVTRDSQMSCAPVRIMRPSPARWLHTKQKGHHPLADDGPREARAIAGLHHLLHMLAANNHVSNSNDGSRHYRDYRPVVSASIIRITDMIIGCQDRKSTRLNSSHT